MRQVFCDIVPHCDGWVCLVEGRSPQDYSSFHLALSAARTIADDPLDDCLVIIRRQDQLGQFRTVGDDELGFLAPTRRPQRH